jgi:hypothetical protein
MHRALLTVFVLLAAAIVLPVTAEASGGRYVFAGGTPRQQATVTQALDASSFNWSVVPGTMTIRIARGLASEAVPGEIRLDADLLDSGTFSWGVVQHEYAHQVDFFLLSNDARSTLLTQLGATTWWPPAGTTLPHAAIGGERFASTLAWAYWTSPANVMRPASTRDEAGSMAPAAFRALLASLLSTAAAPTFVAAPPSPAHAPLVPHAKKKR